MPGPDADDHHHSAAAISGGATLLLTHNRADFPTEPLAGRGLRVTDPGTYLCELADELPGEVDATVERLASEKKRPPKSAADLLDDLTHAGVDVDLLLSTAAKLVGDARADCGSGGRRLFEAEQTELLVRLAADSGARRGELAALKTTDLDDRVVHICRNVSGRDTITTPKSHQ